ncbi:MAG: hypothetical protein IIB58_00120 [Planctomycetes bacterium]|nr:hypothetical protein [Planctomycetota bacterium]
MLNWILAAAFVILPVPEQTEPELAKPMLPPPLATEAYPEGVTTEHGYVDWLAAQYQKFEREIESAAPTVSARHRAHLGNWTLAVRCEPHLTRLLLGIAEAPDIAALRSLSEGALGNLAAARERWPEDLGEQLEDLELITNFGRAVSLLARAKLGRPDQKRTEKVANELAIWMDDDRREIADAAVLWHCALHHEIGNTARALKTLPLPLTPINGSTTELYLRVLRCSILSDSGSPSLALALILRMEERLEQWIPDPATRQAALCTLTWFRFRIAKSHPPEGDGLYKEIWQDWLARAQTTLEDPDAPCRLIRLIGAIPLLLAKPEPASGASPSQDKAAEPASPPAGSENSQP